MQTDLFKKGYCAPVWTGGLTVGQARQIQRVLHRAVAAITGGSREVHRLLQPPWARARRLRLCSKFAKQMAIKSRHQDTGFLTLILISNN